jgi:protoporphyrinogen oxidase
LTLNYDLSAGEKGSIKDCSAYLAWRGQSVALYEKQSKIGGLMQTFKRNSVYFDAGLRSI